MNEIKKEIFKAYDIRGIYPNQLNEKSAYFIAAGFATLLKQENKGKDLKVVVGRDMRLSSPSLQAKVMEAMVDRGIDVVDVGLATTPTFYFAVAYYGYDGGLQVSASHNPAEYNGMKLVRHNAIPVSKDSGIFTIRDMIERGSLAPVSGVRGVIVEKHDVLRDLIKEQKAFAGFTKTNPFKIVIDPANAMGSLDMEALFGQLSCELVKMNFKLDGTFPSHQPDPMVPDNMETLRQRVLEEKADLGIAPDGDGDRYFFVDEKGEIVPQAILRGLMAQIELNKRPGATVAYDIRPGKITLDMIEAYKGKPVVTPVGHSLIKEAMIKHKAIFGGESSGHYFYKFDYGTFEAPVAMVLKILEYLTRQKKPFSEVLAPFNKYSHSGEINTRMASREQIERKIEEIKERYSDGKQVFIDGVSVEYPDVWFNLRASNTEPLIRLTVEGRNKAIMEKYRDDIMSIIKS